MPRIVIFLSIASVIFYVANLVVYEAAAAAFGITAGWQLVVLGSILGALSAGFIGMMILGRYFYNLLTRAVYTALATWMGTFAYMFFAAVAFGLTAGLAALTDYPLPLQLIGTTFFAIALLVSIYGVLHAWQINVARYNVALPNLPEGWKNKKAIFISDLHLGQLHTQSFARKVAAAVNTLTPDIIFIGGDLYDGPSATDLVELAQPLSTLRAPWGVLYITGNHEEFSDNKPFLDAVRKLGMRILMDEVVDIHGLQLAGVDYHNANTVEGFKTILKNLNLDPLKPSILLKHEPNNLDVAEAAGINLQISGHTHKGQQWPFGYLAQLSYKGFAYGLKPLGRMQQLTSSGIGTWGPPQRVGSNSEIVEITFV